MNFYDNFSDLATLEEADEERKKMNQIYKAAHRIINPVGRKTVFNHWSKTIYFILKYGHSNLYKAIHTCQRHNLIGLSYGGKTKQVEIAQLQKNVRELIPEHASLVLHLDIQTSAGKKGNYEITVEDHKSFKEFSNFSLFPIHEKKSKSPFTSIISGIRDNTPNWTSGVLNIASASQRKRFVALRNENLHHCLNI